jgi:ankyrin repeat protein
MRGGKVVISTALVVGLCLGLMASLAAAAVPGAESRWWADRSEPNLLVERAGAGDLDAVRQILGKGADVNVRTVKGETALMTAALNGDFRMVSLLIRKGANPNLKDVHGDTALTLAATKGHANIVRSLLMRGADVNARNVRGTTPLMWAAAFGHERVVKLLILKGANVNATINPNWTCALEDCKFKTALDAAKMNGHHEIVKLLKKAGAKA